MSARKRKSKQHTHEMLMKGMTNDANGKWISDSSQVTTAYVERGTKNKTRNRINREHRKQRAEKRWFNARDKATAVLRKEGDQSEPLEWFVAQHINHTNNGKTRS